MDARSAGVLFVAVSAIAFAAASCGSGSKACNPGTRTLDRGHVHVFCGPARATATVRVNAHPVEIYHFRNGECRRSATHFAVNIGKLVLGRHDKGRLLYFGLLLGAPPGLAEPEGPIASRDGMYRGGLISIYAPPATAYSVSGAEQLRITLRDGRQAGSFAGTRPRNNVLNTPAVSVAGTFTC